MSWSKCLAAGFHNTDIADLHKSQPTQQLIADNTMWKIVILWKLQLYSDETTYYIEACWTNVLFVHLTNTDIDRDWEFVTIGFKIWIFGFFKRKNLLSTCLLLGLQRLVC